MSQVTFFRKWGNVILLDPRGTGASESNSEADYHISTYTDDVEAIRQHFKIEQGLIIVGLSYGAIAAQDYVLKYGTAFLSALILISGSSSYEFIDSACCELDKIGNADQKKQFARLLEGQLKTERDFHHYVEALMPLYSLLFSKDVETFTKRLPFYENQRLNAEALTAAFRPNGFLRVPEFDYRKQLPTISCPTLIIGARNDWIMPPDQQTETARLIQESKLCIIDEASHMLFIDQPQKYFESMERFLSQLPATPH
jgi:proline iminopeptidase